MPTVNKKPEKKGNNAWIAGVAAVAVIGIGIGCAAFFSNRDGSATKNASSSEVVEEHNHSHAPGDEELVYDPDTQFFETDYVVYNDFQVPYYEDMPEEEYASWSTMFYVFQNLDKFDVPNGDYSDWIMAERGQNVGVIYNPEIGYPALVNNESNIYFEYELIDEDTNIVKLYSSPNEWKYYKISLSAGEDDKHKILSYDKVTYNDIADQLEIIKDEKNPYTDDNLYADSIIQGYKDADFTYVYWEHEEDGEHEHGDVPEDEKLYVADMTREDILPTLY